MSTTEIFLLEQLKKPGFHAGGNLGQELGISRAAISKHMASLRKKGLPLISSAGQGYRLEPGIILLDEGTIRAHLSGNQLAKITALDVHQELNSTNLWLLEQPLEVNRARICVAESQPGGRGRRDRQWQSSPYRNLMLSFAWRFANWPSSLSSVTLLAGLAVVQALELCGVKDLKIKWPNDVYLKNAKLGGLLVSAKGEASGACDLVIGVGINHELLPADGENIDQVWTDLKSHGYSIDRNRLAALLTEAFIDLLPKFENVGFGPFKSAWNARCLYLGQEVRIFKPNSESIVGICRGVDDEGVLYLENAEGSSIAIRDADLSMRLVSTH